MFGILYVRQNQHLPVCPRLRPRRRHEALHGNGAGTRIRRTRQGLHLRVAPAGSGRRLLRRRDDRDPGRFFEREGADGFYRGRAVPLS